MKTSYNGGADFKTLYTYAKGKTANSTTNNIASFTQQHGDTELLKYYYSFDSNGNIAYISENTNKNDWFEEYEYDWLNQLTHVVDRKNHTYTRFYYDDGGNIVQVDKSNYDAVSMQPSGLISRNTYAYGDTNWKDKLTKFNNSDITYDKMGNPLSYRDGLSFTWENGRQLKTVTNNGTTLTMRYDSNGLRTKKGNVRYYYDSDNNLIALVSGSNTLFFYYDENGSATSLSRNGTMYFYVKNLQGDIINIVNANGNVVVRYDYDVLGKITAIKNGSNQTITDTSSLAYLNPLRYRGYVFDDETGLYYLQSRYYDPVTGRFLNADEYFDTETGSPLSTNMFAYCENNDLIRNDRTGKKSSPSGIYTTPNTTGFNCYAYALGIYTDILLPGYRGYSTKVYYSIYNDLYSRFHRIKIKGIALRKYTLGNVFREVQNDLYNMNINYRLGSKNTSLKKGEYRIALRTIDLSYFDGRDNAYHTNDFHFMKQDPNTGEWYHKAGIFPIQKLGRINPDNYKNWPMYEHTKTPYSLIRQNFVERVYKNVYYNSGTKYLIIKKKFTRFKAGVY